LSDGFELVPMIVEQPSTQAFGTSAKGFLNQLYRFRHLTRADPAMLRLPGGARDVC